jgi:hypothetical protein
MLALRVGQLCLLRIDLCYRHCLFYVDIPICKRCLEKKPPAQRMALSLDNFFTQKIANAIVLGALAYSLASIVRSVLRSGSGPTITESPLKTLLPKLSEQEKRQLSYRTDALPGARDVASPYGSIRVHEWGPESGRKVLFVHGISTPSIALGSIAHALVDDGCRVMLFDLYDVSLPILPRRAILSPLER